MYERHIGMNRAIVTGEMQYRSIPLAASGAISITELDSHDAAVGHMQSTGLSVEQRRKGLRGVAGPRRQADECADPPRWPGQAEGSACRLPVASDRYRDARQAVLQLVHRGGVTAISDGIEFRVAADQGKQSSEA